MQIRLRKVLTWRILSFSIASVVSVAYFGELRRPLVLTCILTVLMTVIHYIFEHFWDKLVPEKSEK